MGFISIGLDNGKTITQELDDACITPRMTLLAAILLEPTAPTMGEISEPRREYEVEPMPTTVPITEPSPPAQPATPEKEPVPA